MVNLLTTALLIVAAALFTGKRLLRYLRYYQQEEYNSKRFLKWIRDHRAFDRRGSLIALIGLLLPESSLVTCAAAIALAFFAFFEEDPRTEGKVRLKMTERATRLYLTAAVLASLFFTLIAFESLWLAQLFLFQLTPGWLLLACLILDWEERRRQQRFLSEAKEMLAQVSPFVIGITGSYGKTSTKHALAHLLRVTLAPTFWTAKGINTPMGNRVRSGQGCGRDINMR